MGDLLGQIKALQAKRLEHEAALQAIDEELTDVRRALGIDLSGLVRRVTPKPLASVVPRARWTGDGSHTEKAVLHALSVREPMTTPELCRAVPGTTVKQILPRMVERGVIVERIEPAGRYKRRLYARSADAFEQYRADQEAAEAVEAEAG